MGNQQSRIYQRLWQSFPNPDNKESWFSKESKPFANHEDKSQFCHAAVVVLSQNGSINLEMHDVKLLYSRRDDDRLVARIVAERDGIVKAQVAARNGGKDQNEAFKALRNHIERCLDTILKDVPGSSYNGLKDDSGAGPSRQPLESGIVSPTSPTRTGSGSIQRLPSHGISQVPIDAPPAYGRAVKDWRSANDDKK